MIKPLHRPHPLAKGPHSAPKYSKTVQTQLGEFQVASPEVVRGLIALMDMQAVLGGAASHFGGPSALAEINSALYGYVFDRGGAHWMERFHLVNDAGHCENGLYALKALYGYADLNIESLKGFRSIHSPLTGHGEHHIFPEGVFISNGPLGSAVAQAQGLAVADKFAGIDRVTVLTLSDGACMEGEVKEAFASIPGLARQGKMNPFVVLISDNNTKLSGRIDSDAFSMQPTFASLSTLGWNVVQIEDGHDLKACLEAIGNALENCKPDQPWALHFKTIKGYGHSASEKSSSGGHGFPLKKAEELAEFLQEVLKGEPMPEEFSTWLEELKNFQPDSGAYTFKSESYAWLNDHKDEKIQTGISKALIDYKNKNFPIISVTSDLPGSTGVADFRKAFPDSCIDVGVAESNMVSLGAGLSKVGYIPVVDTFAQFGVTKGALPLTMANLSCAPVIAVFSHTGFQDAADGASHQALSYFSMVASIPYTKVFALSSSEEAYALMGQALEEYKALIESGKTPYSYVFFLGRENFKPTWKKDLAYKLGQAQVIAESSKSIATVVAAGSLLTQAMRALDQLEQTGQSIDVIHPSCLNHIDLDPIVRSLQKTGGKLIVMEDHQQIAGFGQHLVGEITKSAPGLITEYKSLAVAGQFGQSAYLADELYRKHQMDAQALLECL